jgi:hypothetical protein
MDWASCIQERIKPEPDPRSTPVALGLSLHNQKTEASDADPAKKQGNSPTASKECYTSAEMDLVESMVPGVDPKEQMDIPGAPKECYTAAEDADSKLHIADAEFNDLISHFKHAVVRKRHCNTNVTTL